MKALVIELIEGPMLADRIAQGPIPIDEALPIARQISTAGGTEPIWAAKGREILYRREGQFLSATIRSLSPFRVDPPRVLFATKGQYDSTSPLRSWNVSADGERFLLSRFAESTDKAVTAIHVVLNWADGLRR